MQKRLLVFFITIIFISIHVYSQNIKSYPYYIEWDLIDGAGGYVIDVQNTKGVTVFTKQLNSKTHTIELQLPAGLYTFQITTLNKFLKPENSTNWVSIEILALTPPKLLSYNPISLLPDDPLILSLKVARLSLNVSAVLISPSGQKTQLKIKKIKLDSYQLSGPPQKEPGIYSIILTNPPNFSIEIKSALTIKSLEPKPPVITLTEPIYPDTQQEPEVTEDIIKKDEDQGIIIENSSIITSENKKAEKVQLVPGKITLGVGVNYDIPFGKWTTIYEGGNFSGFVCGEYYCTENQRPKKGYTFDFSIGLRGEYAKWYNDGSSIYVESTLQNISVYAYPAFSLSLPFIKTKYTIGAGINVINLKAAAIDGLQTYQKVSIDPVIGTGLTLSFPIKAFFSIDVSNHFIYIFNLEPLYKYSLSLGITCILPGTHQIKEL